MNLNQDSEFRKLFQNKFFFAKSVQKDYSLERLQKFLVYLGNPEKSLKLIHIGGTSGKTSVSTITSKLLIGQGFKTGTFISPHVFKETERISVNLQNIKSIELLALLNEVKNDLEKYQSTKIDKSLFLTEFEAFFVIAIKWFVKCKVDVAVIEVGLGGKLDSTNVIYPAVAVVTSIGLDHTEILGDTKSKILKDKMMIFKKGVRCITGVKEKSLVKILNTYCVKNNIDLFEIGHDFFVSNINVSFKGTSFNFAFKNINKKFFVSLLGEHQAINSSLAIASVILFLKQENRQIDLQIIEKSLQNVKVLSRFEVKSLSPFVIWDIAHNLDKVTSTVKTINSLNVQARKVILIIAYKQSKNKNQFVLMLNELSKIKNLKQVIFSSNYKTQKKLAIKNFVLQNSIFNILDSKSILEFNDPEVAYKKSLSIYKNNDIILVTGSTFIFKEFIK